MDVHLTPVVRTDGTSSTAELRDIEVKASNPERKVIAKHFFAQLSAVRLQRCKMGKYGIVSTS